MLRMERREFVALLGAAAAAWPFSARAQQSGRTYRLGLLSNGPAVSPLDERRKTLLSVLAARGFVEGQNLVVVQRAADAHPERLEGLVAELKAENVDVIATFGYPAALAAKTSTKDIPIVVVGAGDPVEGNLTGINFYNSELVAKQLELLRELVPQAAAVAVFVNPASTNTFEATLRDIEPASRAMGLKIKLLRASTSREIDAAFQALAAQLPDALFIGNDAFFNSRRVQFVQLAAHHRLPAIYSGREYSEIGGLISYGTNIGDAYRQVGLYAGRILKGAKPSDLPVLQSSKFELVINHQTARTLGLTVPDKLLVAADEVIE
jgi:putative tryptophan/tyrosine transport system substrate-binding protein